MGSVNLNLAPKSRVWTRAADEFLIIWAGLIGGGARVAGIHPPTKKRMILYKNFKGMGAARQKKGKLHPRDQSPSELT